MGWVWWIKNLKIPKVCSCAGVYVVVQVCWGEYHKKITFLCLITSLNIGFREDLWLRSFNILVLWQNMFSIYNSQVTSLKTSYVRTKQSIYKYGFWDTQNLWGFIKFCNGSMITQFFKDARLVIASVVYQLWSPAKSWHLSWDWPYIWNFNIYRMFFLGIYFSFNSSFFF